MGLKSTGHSRHRLRRESILWDTRPFEALGKVVASMSTLEQVLQLCLSAITVKDMDLGVALYRDIYFKRLIELLQRAVKYRVRHKKTLIEFEKIIERIVKLEKQRNEYVHSVWQYNDSSHITKKLRVIRHKNRGHETEKKKVDKMMILKMQYLSVEINFASRDISDFVMKTISV